MNDQPMSEDYEMTGTVGVKVDDALTLVSKRGKRRLFKVTAVVSPKPARGKKR